GTSGCENVVRKSNAGKPAEIGCPCPLRVYITDRLVIYSPDMTLHQRQDRRWTRRKEERPAELMAAALDLFVERGYAATRLDDVAARAGVSKGTLYLYFSSKEELFKAVIRSGIVPLIEQGERLQQEHRGGAGDLLRKIVLSWWQSVGSSKLGGIPKLMFSECRNFPEIGQFYFEEVISRSYRLIESVMERGMQSGEFR